jgi:hypothetical protein
MGLNYKNIRKGHYRYSEISGNKDDDSSVKSNIGDQWYLHVLADLVSTNVLNEVEFMNFFQNFDEGIELP